MKYYIAAALVVIAGLTAYLVLNTSSDRVATLSNGVTITLHTTPCKLAEVKEFLESQIGTPALAATVRLPDALAKEFDVPAVINACYVDKGAKIAIADELGQGGFVGSEQFK